jgi:phosphoglycerate dehydrogenase-like enzyme
MMFLRGLYILDDDALQLIYGPQERRDISRHVEFVAPPQTKQSIASRLDLLKHVDVIFSGWGMPRADEQFLQAAPKLKAIFYGAGAVGYFMTESVWDRGITLTSAYEANAIPVAEYSLAMLLFSLKHGWSLTRRTQQLRTFPDRNGAPGCYGTVVGLLSLGVTARALLKLLQPLDVTVLAYDPFVSKAEATSLGAELVSMQEVFERCDAVSVHTPYLPETAGLITGAHIAAMKKGATFINTARGEIVREDEMIEVMKRRPDLQAVLDVTMIEPPPKDSPLYSLPNVVLTPHIAGSVGNECRRMGRFMVEELDRYVRGEPLLGVVTRDLAERTCHRPVKVTVHAKAPLLKPTAAL